MSLGRRGVLDGITRFLTADLFIALHRFVGAESPAYLGYFRPDLER
jgi:hypothetical protein